MWYGLINAALYSLFDNFEQFQGALEDTSWTDFNFDDTKNPIKLVSLLQKTNQLIKKLNNLPEGSENALNAINNRYLMALENKISKPNPGNDNPGNNGNPGNEPPTPPNPEPPVQEPPVVIPNVEKAKSMVASIRELLRLNNGVNGIRSQLTQYADDIEQNTQFIMPKISVFAEALQQIFSSLETGMDIDALKSNGTFTFNDQGLNFVASYSDNNNIVYPEYGVTIEVSGTTPSGIDVSMTFTANSLEDPFIQSSNNPSTLFNIGFSINGSLNDGALEFAFDNGVTSDWVIVQNYSPSASSYSLYSGMVTVDINGTIKDLQQDYEIFSGRFLTEWTNNRYSITEQNYEEIKNASTWNLISVLLDGRVTNDAGTQVYLKTALSDLYSYYSDDGSVINFSLRGAAAIELTLTLDDKTNITLLSNLNLSSSYYEYSNSNSNTYNYSTIKDLSFGWETDGKRYQIKIEENYYNTTFTITDAQGLNFIIIANNNLDQEFTGYLSLQGQTGNPLAILEERDNIWIVKYKDGTFESLF